jgi:P27 family predicted phage terminase small subunit
MPRELGKQAKAEWRRIVPELEEMGLIATVDRSVLIRYCRAWEDWFDIDEKLRETGLLVRGQKNNLVRNPLWMMRTDAEATLSDLGKQLGLTPAARLRQGVEHEQPVLEESAPPVVMDKYRKAIG